MADHTELTADDATDWVTAHADQILQHLTELVAIPSIAFPGYDRTVLDTCAEAVKALMTRAGFDEVEILSEPLDPKQPDGDRGGPAVLARRAPAPGAPTILLYAHHDVQPTGDLALWDTGPFTATRIGDRLYGRGAADDKAGIMVHVAAVTALNELLGTDHGLGITVLIEGEEEVASPTFRAFLDRHRDKLAADVVVVADSANWAEGVPAITSSLRGVVDGTIHVKILDHAVHSGLFGGVVLDAATVLSKVIATLHDEHGDVAIPGLHKTPGQAQVDYPEEDLRAQAGIVDSVRLAGTGSIAERLWHKPALSILGTDLPELNHASNTIIPQARAKFSLRIGPGVNPDEAMQRVREHVESLDIFGAEITLEPGEKGSPFSTDLDSATTQLMLSCLRDAFGTDPVATGLGGSIPLTGDLAEVFPEATILITGVEDPNTRAHSANESLYLPDFYRCITAEILLLARLLNRARS
ncbi:M20/M25/M40 family metallo-hydrolase [Auritidibacter sp. NML100628]|uniref:M20/M25/M40 family metallo-hydrolase n=1 Tax=Auritidibacter sp. NML100628 TaxID=2170742 RepID=UPI000D736DF0|nr:M20/M25/M40 family metallo-hydrolase [Auritidibacter sp. NML100628]PXA77844.1 dipeptidase [Auritidibacter sp. NML100628]